MRRLVGALAAAACLTLAVAGCGGGSSGTSAGGVTTLTYWSGFTGGDRPTYEALIKKFNDTHPTIQVKMDVQPWDSIAQKLPTAIASGSGPDIATPDYNVGTIRQYITNHLAAPLDGLIGSGTNQIGAGVLPKTVADAFTVDGHLYAAPANFATLMLYYNRDLFAKAGIANPPTTMQELRDDAVKLTGNGVYGIALADHETIAMWPILIWADGGDLVDAKNCSALSQPATVAAVDSWASLIAGKGISPVGQTGQGADNLFSAGKAAMEINGPWASAAYTAAKVNFDVAPVPTGSSGKPVTLASTVPMILSAQSKHKDAAMTFFAWWNSKDAQAALSQGSGYPPSRTDMADDPRLSSNPFVPKFAAQAANARLYLPDQKDFNKIDTDVIGPAIQKATRGTSAAAALRAASTQLNSITGCAS
jgi:ABC-type glycerol-3-phosphate transport system substrate-binding protein